MDGKVGRRKTWDTYTHSSILPGGADGEHGTRRTERAISPPRPLSAGSCTSGLQSGLGPKHPSVFSCRVQAELCLLWDSTSASDLIQLDIREHPQFWAVLVCLFQVWLLVHSFLRLALGSARRIAGRSAPDLKLGLWVKPLCQSSLLGRDISARRGSMGCWVPSKYRLTKRCLVRQRISTKSSDALPHWP